MNTKGMLNHHIHSPCHSEEEHKTWGLLGYLKVTGQYMKKKLLQLLEKVVINSESAARLVLVHVSWC